MQKYFFSEKNQMSEKHLEKKISNFQFGEKV